MHGTLVHKACGLCWKPADLHYRLSSVGTHHVLYLALILPRLPVRAWDLASKVAEAVVQVNRAAPGSVETELGWKHGVMEKEDVPVWNLLSDTFPHWKGAGSPPLSRGREGYAGRWHGSQSS